jgi:uncharacterized protein YggE
MRCLSIPLAALVLTPIGAVAAQAPAADPAPTVTVSGEGLVQAAPDRAWITLTTETRASRPGEAQRRNAAAMATVVEKLKAAGVAADATRTIGYDLQQEWELVNDRRVLRGFVARNTVEVRVDSIDRAGELLEIAVESGATSVGGLRFGLKERETLEREALRRAVADARARAEAMATAAGRLVERVVRVEERGLVVPPPVPLGRNQVQLAAAPEGAPPLAPGQMEIRAQVTLTAILK